MRLRNSITCLLAVLLTPLAISFSVNTQARGETPDNESTLNLDDGTIQTHREKRQTQSAAAPSSAKSGTKGETNLLQIRVPTQRQQIIAAATPSQAEPGMAFVKKESSISIAEPMMHQKANPNRQFNYPMEVTSVQNHPTPLHHRSFNFPGMEPRSQQQNAIHVPTGHSSSATVGGSSNLDVLTKISGEPFNPSMPMEATPNNPVGSASVHHISHMSSRREKSLGASSRPTSFQELSKVLLAHHARQLLKDAIQPKAAVTTKPPKFELFEPRNPGTIAAGHMSHLQMRNRPAHFDGPRFGRLSTSSVDRHTGAQSSSSLTQGSGNQHISVRVRPSANTVRVKMTVSDMNQIDRGMPAAAPVEQRSSSSHQETFLNSHQNNPPSFIGEFPLHHPMFEGNSAFRIAPARVSSHVNRQHQAATKMAERTGGTATGRHVASVIGHSLTKLAGPPSRHQQPQTQSQQMTSGSTIQHNNIRTGVTNFNLPTTKATTSPLPNQHVVAQPPTAAKLGMQHMGTPSKGGSPALVVTSIANLVKTQLNSTSSSANTTSGSSTLTQTQTTTTQATTTQPTTTKATTTQTTTTKKATTPKTATKTVPPTTLATTPPSVPQAITAPTIGSIDIHGHAGNQVSNTSAVPNSSSSGLAMSGVQVTTSTGSPSTPAQSPAVGGNTATNSVVQPKPPTHPIINLHINFNQLKGQHGGHQMMPYIQQHPGQPANNLFLASGQHNVPQHMGLSRMMTPHGQPVLDMNAIHNISQAIVASLTRKHQAALLAQVQPASSNSINKSPTLTGQQTNTQAKTGPTLVGSQSTSSTGTPLGHSGTSTTLPVIQPSIQHQTGNTATGNQPKLSHNTGAQSINQGILTPPGNQQTGPQQMLNSPASQHSGVQTSAGIQSVPAQLINGHQAISPSSSFQANTANPTTAGQNTASTSQTSKQQSITLSSTGNSNTVPQQSINHQTTSQTRSSNPPVTVHQQSAQQSSSGNTAVGSQPSPSQTQSMNNGQHTAQVQNAVLAGQTTPGLQNTPQRAGSQTTRGAQLPNVNMLTGSQQPTPQSTISQSGVGNQQFLLQPKSANVAQPSAREPNTVLLSQTASGQRLAMSQMFPGLSPNVNLPNMALPNMPFNHPSQQIHNVQNHLGRLSTSRYSSQINTLNSQGPTPNIQHHPTGNSIGRQQSNTRAHPVLTSSATKQNTAPHHSRSQNANSNVPQQASSMIGHGSSLHSTTAQRASQQNGPQTSGHSTSTSSKNSIVGLPSQPTNTNSQQSQSIVRQASSFRQGQQAVGKSVQPTNSITSSVKKAGHNIQSSQHPEPINTNTQTSGALIRQHRTGFQASAQTNLPVSQQINQVNIQPQHQQLNHNQPTASQLSSNQLMTAQTSQQQQNGPATIANQQSTQQQSPHNIQNSQITGSQSSSIHSTQTLQHPPSSQSGQLSQQNHGGVTNIARPFNQQNKTPVKLTEFQTSQQNNQGNSRSSQTMNTVNAIMAELIGNQNNLHTQSTRGQGQNLLGGTHLAQQNNLANSLHAQPTKIRANQQGNQGNAASVQSFRQPNTIPPEPNSQWNLPVQNTGSQGGSPSHPSTGVNTMMNLRVFPTGNQVRQQPSNSGNTKSTKVSNLQNNMNSQPSRSPAGQQGNQMSSIPSNQGNALLAEPTVQPASLNTKSVGNTMSGQPSNQQQNTNTPSTAGPGPFSQQSHGGSTNTAQPNNQQINQPVQAIGIQSSQQGNQANAISSQSMNTVNAIMAELIGNQNNLNNKVVTQPSGHQNNLQIQSTGGQGTLSQHNHQSGTNSAQQNNNQNSVNTQPAGNQASQQGNQGSAASVQSFRQPNTIPAEPNFQWNIPVQTTGSQGGSAIPSNPTNRGNTMMNQPNVQQNNLHTVPTGNQASQQPPNSGNTMLTKVSNLHNNMNSQPSTIQPGHQGNPMSSIPTNQGNTMLAGPNIQQTILNTKSTGSIMSGQTSNQQHNANTPSIAGPSQLSQQSHGGSTNTAQSNNQQINQPVQATGIQSSQQGNQGNSISSQTANTVNAIMAELIGNQNNLHKQSTRGQGHQTPPNGTHLVQPNNLPNGMHSQQTKNQANQQGNQVNTVSVQSFRQLNTIPAEPNSQWNIPVQTTGSQGGSAIPSTPTNRGNTMTNQPNIQQNNLHTVPTGNQASQQPSNSGNTMSTKVSNLQNNMNSKPSTIQAGQQGNPMSSIPTNQGNTMLAGPNIQQTSLNTKSTGSTMSGQTSNQQHNANTPSTAGPGQLSQQIHGGSTNIAQPNNQHANLPTQPAGSNTVRQGNQANPISSQTTNTGNTRTTQQSSSQNNLHTQLTGGQGQVSQQSHQSGIKFAVQNNMQNNMGPEPGRNPPNQHGNSGNTVPVQPSNQLNTILAEPNSQQNNHPVKTTGAQANQGNTMSSQSANTVKTIMAEPSGHHNNIQTQSTGGQNMLSQQNHQTGTNPAKQSNVQNSNIAQSLGTQGNQQGNQGNAMSVQPSNQLNTILAEPNSQQNNHPVKTTGAQANQGNTMSSQSANTVKTIMAEPSGHHNNIQTQSTGGQNMLSQQNHQTGTNPAKQSNVQNSNIAQSLGTQGNQQGNQGNAMSVQPSNQLNTILAEPNSQQNNHPVQATGAQANQGNTMSSQSANTVKTIMAEPSGHHNNMQTQSTGSQNMLSQQNHQTGTNPAKQSNVQNGNIAQSLGTQANQQGNQGNAMSVQSSNQLNTLLAEPNSQQNNPSVQTSGAQANQGNTMSSESANTVNTFMAEPSGNQNNLQLQATGGQANHGSAISSQFTNTIKTIMAEPSGHQNNLQTLSTGGQNMRSQRNHQTGTNPARQHVQNSIHAQSFGSQAHQQGNQGNTASVQPTNHINTILAEPNSQQNTLQLQTTGTNNQNTIHVQSSGFQSSPNSQIISQNSPPIEVHSNQPLNQLVKSQNQQNNLHSQANQQNSFHVPTTGGQGNQQNSLHAPTTGGQGNQQNSLHVPTTGGQANQQNSLHVPTSGGQANQKNSLNVPTPGSQANQQNSLHVPTTGGQANQQNSLHVPTIGGQANHQNSLHVPSTGGQANQQSSLHVPATGGQANQQNSLHVPATGGQANQQSSLHVPATGGQANQQNSLHVPTTGGQANQQNILNVPTTGGQANQQNSLHVPTTGGQANQQSSLHVPATGGQANQQNSLHVPATGGQANKQNSLHVPTTGGQANQQNSLHVPTTGGQANQQNSLHVPSTGGQGNPGTMTFSQLTQTNNNHRNNINMHSIGGQPSQQSTILGNTMSAQQHNLQNNLLTQSTGGQGQASQQIHHPQTIHQQSSINVQRNQNHPRQPSNPATTMTSQLVNQGNAILAKPIDNHNQPPQQSTGSGIQQQGNQGNTILAQSNHPHNNINAQFTGHQVLQQSPQGNGMTPHQSNLGSSMTVNQQNSLHVDPSGSQMSLSQGNRHNTVHSKSHGSQTSPSQNSIMNSPSIGSQQQNQGNTQHPTIQQNSQNSHSIQHHANQQIAQGKKMSSKPVVQQNKLHTSVTTGQSPNQQNKIHASVTAGQSPNQQNKLHASVTTGQSPNQPNKLHASVTVGQSPNQQNNIKSNAIQASTSSFIQKAHPTSMLSPVQSGKNNHIINSNIHSHQSSLSNISPQSSTLMHSSRVSLPFNQGSTVLTNRNGGHSVTHTASSNNQITGQLGQTMNANNNQAGVSPIVGSQQGMSNHITPAAGHQLSPSSLGKKGQTLPVKSSNQPGQQILNLSSSQSGQQIPAHRMGQAGQQSQGHNTGQAGRTMPSLSNGHVSQHRPGQSASQAMQQNTGQPGQQNHEQSTGQPGQQSSAQSSSQAQQHIQGHSASQTAQQVPGQTAQSQGQSTGQQNQRQLTGQASKQVQVQSNTNQVSGPTSGSPSQQMSGQSSSQIFQQNSETHITTSGQQSIGQPIGGNQGGSGHQQANGKSATTAGQTAQIRQGIVSTRGTQPIMSRNQPKQVVDGQMSIRLPISKPAAVLQNNQNTIQQSKQNNKIASVPVDQPSGSSQPASPDPSKTSNVGNPNSNNHSPGSSVPQATHWSVSSQQGNILGSQDLLNIHQNSPIGWISPIASDINNNQPKQQTSWTGQPHLTQSGMPSGHASGTSPRQTIDAAQSNNAVASRKSATSSLFSSNTVGTKSQAQPTSKSGQSRVSSGSQISTSPGQQAAMSHNPQLQQANSHTLASNQHNSPASPSQSRVIPPVPKTLIAVDRPLASQQTSNNNPIIDPTSTQPGTVNVHKGSGAKSVTTRTSHTATNSRPASEVPHNIQGSGQTAKHPQGTSSPSTASHHDQRNSNHNINPRRLTQINSIQHGHHHQVVHSVPTKTATQRQGNHHAASTNLGKLQQGHNSGHVMSTQTGTSTNAQHSSQPISPVVSAQSQKGSSVNGQWNAIATSTKFGASQKGSQNNPVVSAQMEVPQQGQQHRLGPSTNTGTSSNGLQNSHAASHQIIASQSNQQKSPVTSTGQHTSIFVVTPMGTSKQGQQNSHVATSQIGTSMKGQHPSHIGSVQMMTSRNGPQSGPVVSNQIGTLQNVHSNTPIVSTQRGASNRGQQNNHATSTHIRTSQLGNHNSQSTSTNTGTVPNLNSRNTPVVNNNHGPPNQGSSTAGQGGTQQSFPTNNQQTGRKGTSLQPSHTDVLSSASNMKPNSQQVTHTKTIPSTVHTSRDSTKTILFGSYLQSPPSVSGFNQLSPISNHHDIASTNFAFLPPGTATGHLISDLATGSTNQRHVSAMKSSTPTVEALTSYTQSTSKQQGHIIQTTPITSVLFDHPINTNTKVTTKRNLPIMKTAVSTVSISSGLGESQTSTTKVVTGAQAISKPAPVSGITVISAASQIPAMTTAVQSGKNQTVTVNLKKTSPSMVKFPTSTSAVQPHPATVKAHSNASQSVVEAQKQGASPASVKTNQQVASTPPNIIQGFTSTQSSTNSINFYSPTVAIALARLNQAVMSTPASIRREVPAVSSVEANTNSPPASSTAGTKPGTVMTPTTIKPSISLFRPGATPVLVTDIGSKNSAVGTFLRSANQAVHAAPAVVMVTANSNPAVSSVQKHTSQAGSSYLKGTSLPAVVSKANTTPGVTSATATTNRAVSSPPPRTTSALVTALPNTNQTKDQGPPGAIPAVFNAPIQTLAVAAHSPGRPLTQSMTGKMSVATKTQEKSNSSVAGVISTMPSDPTIIPSEVAAQANNNLASLNVKSSVKTSTAVNVPMQKPRAGTTTSVNVNPAKTSAMVNAKPAKPIASSVPSDKTTAIARDAANSNLALVPAQKTTNPAAPSSLTEIKLEPITTKANQRLAIASAPASTNSSALSPPPNANSSPFDTTLTDTNSTQSATSSSKVFNGPIDMTTSMTQARANINALVADHQANTTPTVTSVPKIHQAVLASAEPAIPANKHLAVTTAQASEISTIASVPANTLNALLTATVRSVPSKATVSVNIIPAVTSDPLDVTVAYANSRAISTGSVEMLNVDYQKISSNAVSNAMHAHPVHPTSGKSFHLGARVATAPETPKEMLAGQSVPSRVITPIPNNNNTLTTYSVGQSNSRNKTKNNSSNHASVIHPDSVNNIASQILASLVRMAGNFSKTSSKSNLINQPSIYQSITKSLTDALRHSVKETQVDPTGTRTAGHQSISASQTSKFSKVLANQAIQYQQTTTRPSIASVQQAAWPKPNDMAVTSPPVTKALPKQPTAVDKLVTAIPIHPQQAVMPSKTTPLQLIQPDIVIQPKNVVNIVTSPKPTVVNHAGILQQAGVFTQTTSTPLVVEPTSLSQSIKTIPTTKPQPAVTNIGAPSQTNTSRAAPSKPTRTPSSTIIAKEVPKTTGTPSPTISANQVPKTTGTPSSTIPANQVPKTTGTPSPTANQVTKTTPTPQSNVTPSLVSGTTVAAISTQLVGKAGLSTVYEPAIVAKAGKQTISKQEAAALTSTVVESITATPTSVKQTTALNADKTGVKSKSMETALPSIERTPRPASPAAHLKSRGSLASAFNSEPPQPRSTGSSSKTKAGKMNALHFKIKSEGVFSTPPPQLKNAEIINSLLSRFHKAGHMNNLLDSSVINRTRPSKSKGNKKQIKTESTRGSGSRTPSIQTKVIQGVQTPHAVTVHPPHIAGSLIGTSQQTQNQGPSNSIVGDIGKKDPSYLAWEFAALSAGIAGTTSTPITLQSKPQNHPVIPDVPAGLEFLSSNQRKAETSSNNLLRKLITTSLNPIKSLNNNNKISGKSTNSAVSGEPITVMRSGGRADTLNVGHSQFTNVSPLFQPNSNGIVSGDVNQAQSSIVQSSFDNPFGIDLLLSPERAITPSVVLSAFHSLPVTKSKTPKGVTTPLSYNNVDTKTVTTAQPLGTKDVVNGMPGIINGLNMLHNAVQRQKRPTVSNPGQTKVTEQKYVVSDQVQDSVHGVSQMRYPIDLSVSGLKMLVDVPTGRLNPLRPVQ